MGRKRARLIATAIVASTVLVTAASADFTVTPNPAQNQTAPPNRLMRVVASVRNTSGVPKTISIVKQAAGSVNCAAPTLALASGSAPTNLGLTAGQQVQVVAVTTGAALGNLPATCVWAIEDGTASPETFTTEFHVSNTSTVTWDLQPPLIDFGTPQPAEVQKLLVGHYAAGVSSFTSISIQQFGPADSVRFSGGPCNGQISCMGQSVGSGMAAPFDIECRPTGVGAIVGDIVIYGASAPLASMSFQCTGGAGAGIDIVPQTVDVTDAPPANVQVVGPGTTALKIAEITGADMLAFQFADAACQSPQYCDYSLIGGGPPLPLPATLEVLCTPSAVVQLSTLRVEGTNLDSDTASLRCMMGGTGPAPEIDVSPLTLSAPPTAVGQTSNTTMPLVISNTGDAPLDVGLSFGSAEWKSQNDTCVPSCVIDPASSASVVVQFAPSQHGNRDSTLTVTSNDSDEPAIDVALAGSGNGGVLEVTEPTGPEFVVDFGTIAKGSPVTRTVDLRNTGNVPITVGIGMPGAPFTVSATSVGLGPMSAPGSFDVMCQSASPLAEITRTIALTPSANTYASNTTMVQARCTVANTTLQVAPSVLDFGELRKGSPTGEIAITITNPMNAAPVSLEHVRLSGNKPGLSLAPLIGAQTMGPGASVMTTLKLTTGMDVDVSGVDLEVGVDGEQLVLPIRGKVVTPSAYVAPAMIDLGTACVGTSVRQTVLLDNNGTATLRVLRPVMDASNAFRPLFLDPSSYPEDGAQLFAGDMATVGVEPALSSAGILTGVLTWDVVDLDAAPFDVPLRLRYIDTGTALSPASLAFGTIAIMTASSRQTVTLQNCSSDPVFVDLVGVRAMRGDARAWNVQPDRVEGRVLGPQEKIPVTVAFEPMRPGRHEAEIQLAVQGEPMSVALVGDGFGSVPDPTSFYACTCTGGGTPWPDALPGLALLFVLRRRRHGPSRKM